jgi:hypothetical protein
VGALQPEAHPGCGAGRVTSKALERSWIKLLAEQKQREEKQRKKTVQIWFYIKI